MLTETDLQMQAFSKTDHFVAAVAALSGGTFIKLPSTDHIDNDSLLAKFNELHAELGLLSGRFSEFTSDDEINPKERTELEQIGNDAHRTIQELLALIFRIYCKQSGTFMPQRSNSDA